MTAEGTGVAVAVAVAVAATLAMVPADSSSGNGGGRQERRWQMETEAAVGDTQQWYETKIDQVTSLNSSLCGCIV